MPERSELERRTYVVETGRIHETPAEKEGLVKRVEGPFLELAKPVTYKGQVLLTSPYAQKPKIVLPVKKSVYLDPKNWHKPITYAIRWLLAFVQRIIKMYPEETVFENA